MDHYSFTLDHTDEQPNANTYSLPHTHADTHSYFDSNSHAQPSRLVVTVPKPNQFYGGTQPYA